MPWFWHLMLLRRSLMMTLSTRLCALSCGWRKFLTSILLHEREVRLVVSEPELLPDLVSYDY